MVSACLIEFIHREQQESETEVPAAGRRGDLSRDACLLLSVMQYLQYISSYYFFHFRSETAKTWKSVTESERSRGSLASIAEHVGMLLKEKSGVDIV